MALIACPECKKEISSEASACPNCGITIKKKSPKKGIRFYVGLILLVIGLFILIRLITSPSKPVFQVSSPSPQTLASDRIEIKEGSSQGYGFTLNGPTPVEITVSALSKPVNVYLMNEDQWRAYQEVKSRLLGGQFYYQESFSKMNVLKWQQRGTIPAGQYRIVLERPVENLFMLNPSVVDITIVANPR